MAAVWLAVGVGAMACLRFGMAGVVGVLLGSFAIFARILPAEDALRLALGMASGLGIIGYLPRYLQLFSASKHNPINGTINGVRL